MLKDLSVIAGVVVGLALVAYGVWNLFSPGWAALITGAIILITVMDRSNT